jgi:hypothetical protein
LEIIPLMFSHQQIKGFGSQHWATWKVVHADLKVHKRGKIEVYSKKSTAAALLDELLGGGGDGAVKQEGMNE